jgi:hypothetical protein
MGHFYTLGRTSPLAEREPSFHNASAYRPGTPMKNDRMNDVLRRIEEEERSAERSAMWPLYALGALVLAGVGAAWFFTWKSDKAAGDVVLPVVLRQRASEARQDLGLYVRSLHELAQEADQKLKTPGPHNDPHIAKYRARLVQSRETGRSLEPRVNREESRVLMAATHAQKRIEQFVSSAGSALTYKHQDIEIALRQLERAKKLAAGDEEGADALERTPILGMAAQVKSISTNLADIKKAQKALEDVERESFQDLDSSERPATKK